MKRVLIALIALTFALPVFAGKRGGSGGSVDSYNPADVYNKTNPSPFPTEDPSLFLEQLNKIPYKKSPQVKYERDVESVMQAIGNGKLKFNRLPVFVNCDKQIKRDSLTNLQSFNCHTEHGQETHYFLGGVRKDGEIYQMILSPSIKLQKGTIKASPITLSLKGKPVSNTGSSAVHDCSVAPGTYFIPDVESIGWSPEVSKHVDMLICN